MGNANEERGPRLRTAAFGYISEGYVGKRVRKYVESAQENWVGRVNIKRFRAVCPEGPREMRGKCYVKYAGNAQGAFTENGFKKFKL